MGKAAQRRKQRRLNYLIDLAATNPERFRHEWDTLMSSWLREAWRITGQISDTQSSSARHVFDLVDDAHAILNACKVEKPVLDSAASIDVLINECCKASSREFGHSLYRMNAKFPQNR